MRRSLISWSVAFGLLLLAFTVTIVVLNSTLFSAAGFVRGYLDSLARQDAVGALELAGVELTDAPEDDLLAREYLGELSDFELVREEPGIGRTTLVTYSFVVDGQAGTSQFVVERDGSLLGLFSAWRFAESPLSTVALTVLHDPRFDVNGTTHMTPAEPNNAAHYLVFTPGRYVFGHESTFLTARQVPATITQVGGSTQVVLDVRANDKFVEQVQSELNAHFDEDCATQEVLLPTGCPFGQPMGNRIVSTPEWSITEYPEVRIIPGLEPGTWLMPETSGIAHLTVEVQSLFDGSISTFDEDVPFTVEYLITFLPGDELLIEAQY